MCTVEGKYKLSRDTQRSPMFSQRWKPKYNYMEYLDKPVVTWNENLPIGIERDKSTRVSEAGYQVGVQHDTGRDLVEHWDSKTRATEFWKGFFDWKQEDTTVFCYEDQVAHVMMQCLQQGQEFVGLSKHWDTLRGQYGYQFKYYIPSEKDFTLYPDPYVPMNLVKTCYASNLEDLDLQSAKRKRIH